VLAHAFRFRQDRPVEEADERDGATAKHDHHGSRPEPA
jgi:hypothetical protein